MSDTLTLEGIWQGVPANMSRVSRLMDAIRAVAELERALPRAVTPELREILHAHVIGAQPIVNALTSTFTARLTALRSTLEERRAQDPKPKKGGA